VGRAVVLRDGRVVMVGPVGAVVDGNLVRAPKRDAVEKSEGQDG